MDMVTSLLLLVVSLLLCSINTLEMKLLTDTKCHTYIVFGHHKALLDLSGYKSDSGVILTRTEHFLSASKFDSQFIMPKDKFCINFIIIEGDLEKMREVLLVAMNFKNGDLLSRVLIVGDFQRESVQDLLRKSYYGEFYIYSSNGTELLLTNHPPNDHTRA